MAKKKQVVEEFVEVTQKQFEQLNVRKSKSVTIIKTTSDIRLSAALAGQEAVKQAKSLTITLKDFINEQYHFTEGSGTAFKCTIRDIGLAPFEIDIFDARIILVEVTGKTRKDFDGEEAPERLYRGRWDSISGCLTSIAQIMAKRKINGMDNSVITMREYFNAWHSYNKYIASIVNKDYGKALDAMRDKLPFTQISEGRTDEEDWFK